MVELDEESSNLLFDTLADWEHQLQAENLDFDALSNIEPSDPEFDGGPQL